MAIEQARKFFEQVQADEDLRARTQQADLAEGVGIAAELGLEVTADELLEVTNELRAARGASAESPVELEDSELDKVAGGAYWEGEDAPDGHEMGCVWFYHGKAWQRENNIWCHSAYYCYSHWDECVVNMRLSGF